MYGTPLDSASKELNYECSRHFVEHIECITISLKECDEDSSIDEVIECFLPDASRSDLCGGVGAMEGHNNVEVLA
jgi:hypothetical protein